MIASHFTLPAYWLSLLSSEAATTRSSSSATCFALLAPVFAKRRQGFCGLQGFLGGLQGSSELLSAFHHLSQLSSSDSDSDLTSRHGLHGFAEEEEEEEDSFSQHCGRSSSAGSGILQPSPRTSKHCG